MRSVLCLVLVLPLLVCTNTLPPGITPPSANADGLYPLALQYRLEVQQQIESAPVSAAALADSPVPELDFRSGLEVSVAFEPAGIPLLFVQMSLQL